MRGRIRTDSESAGHGERAPVERRAPYVLSPPEHVNIYRRLSGAGCRKAAHQRKLYRTVLMKATALPRIRMELSSLSS